MERLHETTRPLAKDRPRGLALRWLPGLAGLLLVTVACSGLMMQPQAVAGRASTHEQDNARVLPIDELVEQLIDSQVTWPERESAAKQLTAAAVDQRPGAIDALRGALDAGQPMETHRAVLTAIAGASGQLPGDGIVDTVLAMREKLPTELESAWAQALGRYELERIANQLAKTAGDEQAPLEQRRLATRALGEHRRLFAADLLMDLTSVNRLEQVQGWAFDALANLSHQPTLGRDRAAWAQWYNNVRNLSASDWQHLLHENLLRMTRRKQDLDKQVRDRLTQTQRALYRATAVEQQPAMLVLLLKDPLDSVRLLALELARQRAEDSDAFSPELREELRLRLDDPLSRIREESATLLGQLLDESAADAMAQRLVDKVELDNNVRRAYLIALTQMPRAQALSPAYALLQDNTLQPFAAGMLAAGYRAGQGEVAFWDATRERVWELLTGVESPRPQMVSLLGLVIHEQDTQGWSRIGNWLDVKDDSVREAAARVWAASGRSLVVLAERSDDPVIRPIALKAIAERASQEQTLIAVAQRRPTEPEDVRLWEQALVAMAARVPPSALLDVIERLAEKNGETRQVREHMLTAAIDREDRLDEPTRDDLRLLIARAKARVLTDAPALVVLDYEAALKHTDQLSNPQADDARRGLMLAYLADRRVDDALATASAVLKPQGKLIDDANKDPLLESLIIAARQALEQGRKDNAGKLIDGVRTLMGQSLTAEQDAQLKAIKADIDRTTPALPPVEPLAPAQ